MPIASGVFPVALTGKANAFSMQLIFILDSEAVVFVGRLRPTWSVLPSSTGFVRSILAVLVGSMLAVLAGCGAVAPNGASARIAVVAAENEYGNVASQIGGQYVDVTSVETNPNTDPHTFEASPAVARELAAAKLVVINGVGYDAWAQKMLQASPNTEREVVDAQSVLGLPADTENPHLWYNPTTMPRVAAAIAADLSKLQPAHASYFQENLTAFDRSLDPWDAAIAAFKAKYGGTPVAVTEPVGDYLLQAAGCDILTPWSFQAAIMNGTDPSPQDVTLEESLFNDHRVKVFLYNQQVTDSLTASLLTLAEKEGIPVVGVYETMPTGYTYQSWMMAETNALERAVAHGTSTTKL